MSANGDPKSNGDVVRAAEQRLELARSGLMQARSHHAGVVMAGLGNVAFFGVSVTQALQGLRHLDKGFEPWYGPRRAQMQSDPLMRYFWDLRLQIFHKSDSLAVPRKVSLSRGFYLKEFRFPEDMQKLGPPPPGATGFFMGDQFGRSGWTVPLPGGGEGKFYVSLPPSIGWPIGPFTDSWPPIVHLGKDLGDASPEGRCVAYLAYLGALLAEAKIRFA